MTPLTSSFRGVHACERALETLSDTRVVLLNGARQAAKSTLAHLIADEAQGSEFRSLDQPQWLSAAEQDPSGFVEHAKLLVIDEIQRAPALFLPIKHQVDIKPNPGSIC